MKIKLLKGIMLLGAVLSFGFIQAQDVSGTVVDNNGVPLPGANVIVKGTTNGAQTDFDGNYSLTNVASDATLEISYIGYATQDVAVNGRSTINVTMEESASALDEVIIIGYGTTTIKDATGSVASVKAGDFNGGVISSPEQLIQGKTAGVQISATTGEPGAGIQVRVRGTNSVRSNNNPLFVVDGVPLSGGDVSSEGQDLGFGSSPARNPLNFLNPNDIDSISILKDASATAIYGSRGANGVIIITTKSGKGFKGRFGFTSTLNLSSPAEEYNLLSTPDFLNAVTQFGGNAAAQNFGSSTNWQRVITRAVASQDQNLSYSTSYKDGSVRGTFGYATQYGVVEKTDLERITGRLNANHAFFDGKLRFNLQSTISRVNDQAPAISGSAGFQGDLLGAAYSANPTWPADPEFDSGGQRNPLNMLEHIESLTNTNRFLVNLSTEYDVTDELKAKVTLGYDDTSSSRGTVADRLARNAGNGIFGIGRGTVSDLDTDSKLLEATLNYDKDFGNSQLSALVGFSYQDFSANGRTAVGWGFGNANLTQMADNLRSSAELIESRISGNYQQYGYTRTGGLFVNRLFPVSVGETLVAPTGVSVASVAGDTFDNTDELQSFFARINYTLNNKYLFTATIRADGSSKFGSENQYGYFPSAAVAWKINEEDFIGESVSTLKLRVGGGITGNQEGLGYANFIRRERFGGIGIGDDGSINVPGLAPVAFANPDLKWEETLQYGVGLDFGFNNDRLSGSIDVYRKETTDLLLNIQAAQPSPQPSFFKNLDATVLNQGIEFALAYDLIQNEDLTWNAGFNVAYNENELQDFAGLIPAGTIRGQGLSLAFAQILAEGQPLFSYFLREFEGFDSSGQPIGDVQTFVGKSALPDITAGFSTSVSYKNWDLNAYLSGQFGHYVYNNTRNAFFTAGAINNARNVTYDVISSGEAGSAEAAVSTRFLEKGDFVRLQSASLGYTVPLSGEGLFKSMKLFINGQNLFLITDYTGLDPEVSTNSSNGGLLNGLPTAGIDYAAYPRARSFSLGFNVTF